jgi:phosphoesterase RecJ-like protein
VGSQLALRSALLRLGKEVTVCSAGPFYRTELSRFTDFFITIPDKTSKKADKEIEGASVILLDCSGKDRTGDVDNFFDKYPCAIIDHHAASDHSQLNLQEPVYIDINCPSCTLLIFKLIKALGLEITKDEAEFLLFGLCTDTGFFRHLTEKNADVFEAAAAMISKGASPKNIFYAINGGKSLNSRIQIGNILARTESFFDGKLLISCETLEEHNKFGLEGRDSDALNQMLLSIENVEALVIIRQESTDNCTVSLRSIDKINVAEIAASFKGGGHKNASGLTMKGDIPTVKEKILNSFQNIFN